LIDRVILGDLNLHSTFWRELGNDHRVCDLLENCRIGLAAETIIKGMKVCCGNDERKMCWLKKIIRTTRFDSIPTNEHLKNRTQVGLVPSSVHSRMVGLYW